MRTSVMRRNTTNNSPPSSRVVVLAAVLSPLVVSIWTAIRAYQHFTNYEHFRSLDGFSTIFPLIGYALIWGLIPGAIMLFSVLLSAFGGPKLSKYIVGVFNVVGREIGTAIQRRNRNQPPAKPDDDPPSLPIPTEPLTRLECAKLVLITVNAQALWSSFQVYTHYVTWARMMSLNDFETGVIVSIHGFVWGVPPGVLYALATLASIAAGPRVWTWIQPLVDVLVGGTMLAFSGAQNFVLALRSNVVAPLPVRSQDNGNSSKSGKA